MMVAINTGLAIVKISTGLLGNSYALIADGLESTMDIVTSFIVWSSMQYAARPPDQNHPYGHGKAESLASVFAAIAILGTAALIATQSIREIITPHGAPAAFTLPVLVVVIVLKEFLFRRAHRVGSSVGSGALMADAWHQRSDAITSAAAFLGISIALIGGEGFEPADDWAALAACSVIVYNGIRLLLPALDEVMDAQVSEAVETEVRGVAEAVAGVLYVEKCRIRKSGIGLFVDIHVTVDGSMTVSSSHEIAHAVTDALNSSNLPVHDVVVHVEPDNLYRDNEER